MSKKPRKISRRSSSSPSSRRSASTDRASSISSPQKTDEKGGLDKDKGEKIIEANRKRLNDFQEKLYAQDRWSLLLIFQGMDAAGKDSAIKSVFDGVNPQGCEVIRSSSPSPTNSITISCGAA